MENVVNRPSGPGAVTAKDSGPSSARRVFAVFAPRADDGGTPPPAPSMVTGAPACHRMEWDAPAPAAPQLHAPERLFQPTCCLRHGALHAGPLLRTPLARELGRYRFARPLAPRLSREAGRDAELTWHCTDELPLFSVRFGPEPTGRQLLAVSDEEGSVSVVDPLCATGDAYLHAHVPAFSTAAPVVARWHAHNNAVFELAWCGGGSHLAPRMVTTSGDYHAALWDVSTQQCLCAFHGHTGTLRAIAMKHGSPFEFATAGRDGHVMIWDSRAGTAAGAGGVPAARPVSQMRSIHVKGTPALPPSGGRRPHRAGQRAARVRGADQSVSGLCFFPGNHVLATAGAVDGLIKLWDIRRPTSSSQTPTPILCLPDGHRDGPLCRGRGRGARLQGFTSLAMDERGTRLAANCRDHTVYLYDAVRPDTAPVRRLVGHRVASFYVKAAMASDGSAVISASSDGGHVCVWDTRDGAAAPAPPGDLFADGDACAGETPTAVLRGHTRESNGVAWCDGDRGLAASCSDDGTVRVWRLAERPPPVSRPPPPLPLSPPATPPRHGRRLFHPGRTQSSPARPDPSPRTRHLLPPTTTAAAAAAAAAADAATPTDAVMAPQSQPPRAPPRRRRRRRRIGSASGDTFSTPAAATSTAAAAAVVHAPVRRRVRRADAVDAGVVQGPSPDLLAPPRLLARRIGYATPPPPPPPQSQQSQQSDSADSADEDSSGGESPRLGTIRAFFAPMDEHSE